MSDGSAWLVCVVDETDGRCLNEFVWGGELYPMPEGMALALIQRRLQRLLDGYLAGEGRVAEKIHFGEAVAPRMRDDGVWLTTPPNVG